MRLIRGLIILGAGVIVGIINVVAGAGTLITVPTLLALGIPSVTANVSNTVGLVPASVTGAIGYRRELAGQWRAVLTMAAFSAVGGIAGGILLLAMPESSFSAVVPYLLLLAALLSAILPRVARFVRRHATESSPDTRLATYGLILGVMAAGIYFGAAQGVVLLALLGILWSTDLNGANGAKNVLAGVANIVSAVIFIPSGTVDWMIALLVGVGSAAGGLIGARIGRRLPAPVLRIILVVVALTTAIVLFLT